MGLTRLVCDDCLRSLEEEAGGDNGGEVKSTNSGLLISCVVGEACTKLDELVVVSAAWGLCIIR